MTRLPLSKPTIPRTAPIQRISFWTAGLCLALILAGLFWRSFLPGIVHFSNDAPLGAHAQDRGPVLQWFSGMWADLNFIGANGGNASWSISFLLRLVLGPVGFVKFYAPAAQLILGMGAFYFFRQLRFSAAACLLGAIAAVLNTSFLSAAAWGVAAQTIAYGADFIAMGLVVFAGSQTRAIRRWVAVALAGLAVGINVIEAADIGALFSMIVAAFVVVQSMVMAPQSSLRGAIIGFFKVGVICFFAAFLAFHMVSALIGTQIQGIVGTEQNTESRAQKWDWATQWSLPKAETLSLAVPGLFGYRMDTPKGGNYWGAVGSDPSWDRYFAGGKQGEPPRGFQRFNGGSPYAGILVLMVGAWAIVQSWRRSRSVYTRPEQCLIWFWATVALVALLLSWGRFAPFYQIVYALPYFSTIRNPTKFFYIINFAATILFAYGVHGLWTRHVAGPVVQAASFQARLVRWWKALAGVDRRWAVGSLTLLGGALLAVIVYSASRSNLERHLAEVGFAGSIGKSIAEFSILQAWIFIGYLTVSICWLFAVLSGAFSGRGFKRFTVVAGLFLLADLGRADLPFIVHVDYKHKYDLDLKNPVMELLSHKPNEQRVAGLPFPVPEQLELLNQVYRIEWAQHHFPYHNIQSLDILQMPRVPVDWEAYEKAWAACGTPGLLRKWELTNTRYLLGPASFTEGMNAQLDPVQKRFSVKLPFAIQPKPGVKQASALEDLTAVSNANGPYAVIEFAGALPRASLFSNWIVSTNDSATLTNLFRADFDPRSSVFVAEQIPPPTSATNASAGTVEFETYAPASFKLKVDAKVPAVLLLNDRYDPNWKVLVDGQPAPLLRCNFIMRGVQVPAGSHTVEFIFRLPMKSLFVTMTAVGIGGLLLGALIVTRRQESPPMTDAEPSRAPGKPVSST